jgi:hypothetical protein
MGAYTLNYFVYLTHRILCEILERQLVSLTKRKCLLEKNLLYAKDKCKQVEKSGIYEIKCDGCNAVYIGQTRRSVTLQEYLVSISNISDA